MGGYGVRETLCRLTGRGKDELVAEGCADQARAACMPATNEQSATTSCSTKSARSLGGQMGVDGGKGGGRECVAEKEAGRGG